MAVERGKKGQYAEVKLKVGETAVTVAKLRNWSISVSTNKIDDSAAGQDWETHIIGMANWTGSAEFIDADQYWLDNIFDIFDIEFYDSDKDPAPAYIGSGSLDFDREVPYDDLISTSIEITGNGELKRGGTP